MMHHKPTLAAASLLSFALSTPPAQADDNCATLAQAAAAGLSARVGADDQTIKPPQSVTTLSCLDNFFNGVGLNVVTNLLNPGNLLQAVQGRICQAVTAEWQNIIGAAQCGLTVTGFNVGFGGLGGGSFCPRLSFGGGGSTIGSINTGLNNTQGGLSITGTGVPPTGYTLPTGTNF